MSGITVLDSSAELELSEPFKVDSSSGNIQLMDDLKSLAISSFVRYFLFLKRLSKSFACLSLSLNANVISSAFASGTFVK